MAAKQSWDASPRPDLIITIGNAAAIPPSSKALRAHFHLTLIISPRLAETLFMTSGGFVHSSPLRPHTWPIKHSLTGHPFIPSSKWYIKAFLSFGHRSSELLRPSLSETEDFSQQLWWSEHWGEHLHVNAINHQHKLHKTFCVWSEGCLLVDLLHLW